MKLPDKLLLIAALLTIFLLSCEEEKVKTSKIIVDPVFAKDLLEKSYDTVTIGSLTCTLDVFIYMDLMPPKSEDGNTITSVNCVAAFNGLYVTESTNLMKQYVINSDSIWVSLFEKYEDNGTDSTKKCMMSTNGPAWTPGTVVDVVAEIFDSEADTTLFIRALDQTISSTNR